MNKSFDVQCKTSWKHVLWDVVPTFPTTLQVTPRVGEHILGYIVNPTDPKGSSRLALEFIITKITHTSQRIYLTVEEPLI